MLIGIVDKQTGRTYHVCGGFPSASGKTNLAMMTPPDGLKDRYEVRFYGDDIAWLRVDPDDGRIYAINPEYGVFGVARDTSEATNPVGVAAVEPGTGTLFTNVAYNEDTQAVWWEGRTPAPPEGAGWRDWTGALISARTPDEQDEPWAHPNSRFTTQLGNVPTLADDFDDPRGVPIDAIIFGGRTSDREPLIRAITDVAEGVYDGLTLGAEATFAAEGVDGQLRYDPMSMRPFLSYPEGAYAAHWLRIIDSAREKPIFAHVNWFQRDRADGHFLWPGYRDNLRPLLWLLRLKDGEVDRAADAGRHPPHPGRARSAGSGGRTPRSRRPAQHRPRSLAPGDDLPRGAPRPVPRPARGGVGGTPPRRARPRRGLGRPSLGSGRVVLGPTD